MVNTFDPAAAMISEKAVAVSSADLSKLYASSTGVFADAARASLQRDVIASYDKQVISYALGEAPVGGGTGTVYPGNTTDRLTSAPWIGLSVMTSAGDCVGVRFSTTETLSVTMPDSDDTCTGGTALVGSAVTGEPAAPPRRARPAPGLMCDSRAASASAVSVLAVQRRLRCTG